MTMTFDWAPYLPYAVSFFLLGLGLALFALSWIRKTPEFYGRAAFFLLLSLLLLHPVLIEEQRKPLPSKLLVVVDESPSQSLDNRGTRTAEIVERLKTAAGLIEGLEPVVVRGGIDPVSLKEQNTSLFSALRQQMIALPQQQIAGTVLITDGQVHDVPTIAREFEKLAPFHAVLTGRKDEHDRRVTVVDAPKYGLLSEDVTIRLKVEDVGRKKPADLVALTVRQDGEVLTTLSAAIGEEKTLSFKLTHPGQNVFEFSVEKVDGELTPLNNRAAVIVNGVRDRLRVLLVSGLPHMGERAWRDLLKSDPAIDLVHFTILRSPQVFDPTPVSEMALIAFPVEELFERKIKEFDLIIFDKYVQYGLLPPKYFENIASYIQNGGAFFAALGSDKLEKSLFNTAVGALLPVVPTEAGADILQGSFSPLLTERGLTHPVTGDLQRVGKSWAAWHTQADMMLRRGHVLMSGSGGKPLLVLDETGEGRIAVLTSDNIWLWAKGREGGGPYTPLLRNVAHWLMKEPELEQDYIKAEVRGNVITVSQRSLAPTADISMQAPDGKERSLILDVKNQAWLSAKVIADVNGIYMFSNGKRSAFAVVGASGSEEQKDVHATAEKLQPFIGQTKGGIVWHADISSLKLRTVSQDARTFAGSGWIGIKENTGFTVSNVQSQEFVSNWLFLMIVFMFLSGIWWREGGKLRRNN